MRYLPQIMIVGGLLGSSLLVGCNETTRDDVGPNRRTRRSGLMRVSAGPQRDLPRRRAPRSGGRRREAGPDGSLTGTPRLLPKMSQHATSRAVLAWL